MIYFNINLYIFSYRWNNCNKQTIWYIYISQHEKEKTNK